MRTNLDHPVSVYLLDVGDGDFTHQCTSRSLRYVLAQLHIAAPDGCSYSSHSLRIGSLSERLHVATNMAQLMAWYDWRMGSMEMLLTYGDRRVQRSAASEIYFPSGTF